MHRGRHNPSILPEPGFDVGLARGARAGSGSGVQRVRGEAVDRAVVWVAVDAAFARPGAEDVLRCFDPRRADLDFHDGFWGDVVRGGDDVFFERRGAREQFDLVHGVGVSFRGVSAEQSSLAAFFFEPGDEGEDFVERRGEEEVEVHGLSVPFRG